MRWAANSSETYFLSLLLETKLMRFDKAKNKGLNSCCNDKLNSKRILNCFQFVYEASSQMQIASKNSMNKFLWNFMQNSPITSFHSFYIVSNLWRLEIDLTSYNESFVFCQVHSLEECSMHKIETMQWNMEVYVWDVVSRDTTRLQENIKQSNNWEDNVSMFA